MSKFEVPQISAEVLQSWPKEAQAYINDLQTLLEQLLAQNQQLLARLNQDSQNSSKPPSTDPPFKRTPKKSKKSSGKSPGGQVGHPRHERKLVPLAKVDQVVELRPWHCANPACLVAFKASDQLGLPLRHQVWELPPLQALVTEYQCYIYECSQCQQLTQPPLPAQAPPNGGQFGPQLVAIFGLLHGQYQLSLRQIQNLALTWWGLEISLGAIAECCTKVSQSLENGYQQVQSQVHQSEAVHVDETGWKRKGKRCWLWVAVAAAASLFRIAPRRNGESLKALIGPDYAGFLHSDRHSPYLGWSAHRHQLCWAHLIRNLRGLRDKAGPGPPQAWVDQCLELTHQLFQLYHTYHAALPTAADDAERLSAWAEFKGKVEPIRMAFKLQLAKGQELADGNVKAFSRELLGLEERLYLFVKEPFLVSPTNNAAERALRPAVIWRKKCFGNQSEGGERFVERVLSVQASCQKQGRSFLAYLKASLVALWTDQTAPPLFASPPTP
jgi:transposase